MGKKFNVNATVVIHLDIITEFEDDGKTDLRDQAHEAVLDHDDVPMEARMNGECEVIDLVYEEIE